MPDPIQQPDPAVTSLTAKAGDKVDNYTIMEQIGAGGTAIVFRGHDHVLNRHVAIKQLVVPPGDAGEDIRQRALAESALHKRAAAADPNLLVQYIDTINDRRGLFLISEYIDGPSLEWILQQQPTPMDQRQALGIIAATAKALAALHKAGMVHRDLKPSNILMPRQGGLKLADFGLAAIIAEQQSLDLGSVRYMAPEILQGQPASPKSDLYSLGMIAYEMLAGRENFNDAFRTILRDQRNQAMRWVKWHTNVRAKVPALNQVVSAIPESLSQLVGRMMEKDPARRVGSAGELLDAIRNFFAAGAQEQPSPHAAMAPPKIDDISQTAQIPRRSKLPLILAATLVIWVAAIGGFFVWKKKQEQQDQAQRTAALITAIEKADKLITDQEYEQARDAFAQILQDHPDQFNPADPRYRDLLVAAGQLKAEALLNASNKNYIAALDKAREYEKRMTLNYPQPASPNTSLSRKNAQDLVVDYTTRAAFQEIADDIAQMIADRKLDDAIQAIRLQRDNSNTNTAQEDIARLDALERDYKRALDDARIVTLLADAGKLSDAGDLRDAVRLLEEERDRAGEDLDDRVKARLDELNRLVLIQTINMQIARAERSGDREELLAALKEMRAVQPTEALDTRINALEIDKLIEQAEQASADGRTDRAQEILEGVLERDPSNAMAKRILASLADARSMIDAIKLGDQALAEGDYDKAITNYKRALTFGPDTSGAINDKIKDATGRLFLAQSEAALDKGDVTTAQTKLDLAKAEHGDTDPIRNLQARINDLRDYTALVAEGDDWYSKKGYGRAKAKYLAARKIFDKEALNQKISNCDFYIWLDQCDQAIQTRDWEAAESALKRAKEIKENEETAARQAQIEDRVR